MGAVLLGIGVLVLRYWAANNIKKMSDVLPEFHPYKDVIPDFIVRLYHILEVLPPPSRTTSTSRLSLGMGRTKLSSKAVAKWRKRCSLLSSGIDA